MLGNEFDLKQGKGKLLKNLESVGDVWREAAGVGNMALM